MLRILYFAFTFGVFLTPFATAAPLCQSPLVATTQRGSAQRFGLYASDPQRCACDIRKLPQHSVDEVRCAYGRHAGDQLDEHDDWSDGAFLWRALADF